MSAEAHRASAREVGIGYTLATGRLFCDFGEFHAYAERLLGTPILTHEFADIRTWERLRANFELQVLAALPGVPADEQENP